MNKRNSTLPAENKELKVGLGPEAMATAEKQVTKLSSKVERLKAALGESEQHRKDLELVVASTRVELGDL
ncbi:hypothetical protein BHE74_00045695 [Ensete ventricosum]|nr:hypothetical protein BHE74_00045695 [Ensete ventricosum]